MLIKHKRRVAFLAALLLSLFCLSACATEQAGPADSTNVYYQFTDDTGVEITLAEKPTCVAVLFSSFAQVWELSGGKVDITVGESVERGFASQDAVLVDGGAGKTINSEALMGCGTRFCHMLCGPCRSKRDGRIAQRSGDSSSLLPRGHL